MVSQLLTFLSSALLRSCATLRARENPPVEQLRTEGPFIATSGSLEQSTLVFYISCSYIPMCLLLSPVRDIKPSHRTSIHSKKIFRLGRLSHNDKKQIKAALKIQTTSNRTHKKAATRSSARRSARFPPAQALEP